MTTCPIKNGAWQGSATKKEGENRYWCRQLLVLTEGTKQSDLIASNLRCVYGHSFRMIL